MDPQKAASYKKAAQIAEKAQIEATVMDLVFKAAQKSLTRSEYETSSHYSRLLLGNNSLTYEAVNNPIIQSLYYYANSVAVWNGLPKGQKRQTKKSHNRTVASSGEWWHQGLFSTISGYVQGRISNRQTKRGNFIMKIDYNKIIADGIMAGYITPNNPGDNGKGGGPGYSQACHAERQAHSLGAHIIGVSKDMCHDANQNGGCVSYFTHISRFFGENNIICDPSCVHIFTSFGEHFELK